MAQETQNIMKEIRLEKVILNMGLGKSGDAVEIAKKALGQISGKKVNERAARKAHRDWGVRKGEPIGAAVTIRGNDAKELLKNGCKTIGEGANMPCTSDAIKLLIKNKIQYAPGKASNAGGVAVSGLEMAQNSLKYTWSREVVDGKLKEIMSDIHTSCLKHGTDKDYINYVKGANIAGFVKVADAMLAQGVV